MRANACKGGREALEGEPQRGSGLEWVWWWSPSSRDSDSSKKLSWRQLEFSNEGGESSDPMSMKATVAIPALMTSDRFHNAT